MVTIVAYVPDLMDRSKLASAIPSTVFVPKAADLVSDGSTIVVIDLGRPDSLDFLPALAGRRTIGFYSHIDRDLADRAHAAGCEEILPRSKFFTSGLLALSQEVTS